MKVLHLISGLMMGGGQRVALDLAQGLRRRAGVAADLGLLGCTSERLREAAAFVVDYDGNYSSVATLAATAWRLRAALRARRYDLVHTHGWDADIIARWAMREMPQPQLAHLHVTPTWVHSLSFKHRVRRVMTRRLLAARPVAILAVAQAVKDHWAGVFAAAAKARVIHNGVDVGLFRPAAELPRKGSPRQPIVLGTACRLAPQKGLATLIDALPRVVAAVARPLRLDIAGDGPLQRELKIRADQLGLGGTMRFLGAVQDMPGFYRSLDLFVLPSESEGMPLAVLEAMASGIAVVAADAGGTAEAVRDRLEGRIVPPRFPEALASALAELISDERLRCSMGDRAASRARQSFALDVQVDRIAELYREIADAAGSARVPLAA